MTKLRDPDSIEDACRLAAAMLGDEAISTALRAKGLRCSPSLIAKWSNPDEPHTPSLEQALTIELLLIKSQNEGVFGKLFDRLKPQQAVGEERLRPMQAASRVVRSAAELMDEIAKADADGVIEPHELITLLAALERVQKGIAPLKRSLFARMKKQGVVIPPGDAGDVKLPRSVLGAGDRRPHKRR